MAITFTTKNAEGTSRNFEVDRHPDSCPICHHNIEPIVWAHPHWRSGASNRLEVPYRCPRRDCQKLFIGTFNEPLQSSTLNLYSTAPYTPISPMHPEKVTELSPSFVEIYRQAAHAEHIKLMEIAGMGYRKALEFLIKDFAIKQHPDQAEAIKAKLLGKCIEDYIDDPNVKRSAKRATWLGNDESHYVRKWEGKDIEDLKKLIQLARNAIENVLLADHYEDDMPEGKK